MAWWHGGLVTLGCGGGCVEALRPRSRSSAQARHPPTQPHRCDARAAAVVAAGSSPGCSLMQVLACRVVAAGARQHWRARPPHPAWRLAGCRIGCRRARVCVRVASPAHQPAPSLPALCRRSMCASSSICSPGISARSSISGGGSIMACAAERVNSPSPGDVVEVRCSLSVFYV